MKRILLSCLFILSCSLCFANGEGMYAVEREDGSVSIVQYFGKNKSLEQSLKDSNLLGRPIVPIVGSDIPKTRADRKYWKMSGKNIVIDESEKQKDILKAQQLEADKTAVLEKLKISKDEYEKLNQKSAMASIN